MEIIQRTAGLAPKSAMEQQKQQLAAGLKAKYGMYLLNETTHFCPFPGCGKELTKTNAGRAVDSYEVNLIDKKKAPEIQNLLTLCPQCYATYSIDDSTKICKELVQVKKILVAHNQSVTLLDDLSLEKGIAGVIGKVIKPKEKDLVATSLDPKEIKQKLNTTDNLVLYNQVNFYVTTYFVRIREIMTNLDKRGEIDYDEVQDQMRAIYKRLKKSKKTNMEIFNEIVVKLHHVTMQEDVYCQIIVSYFIQSCEVFYAITK